MPKPRNRRKEQDEVVEDLEQMIKDFDVPPAKRAGALGKLRTYIAKKMAEAQVRGVRLAQQELKKEDEE